jgi:molybdopterin synthase sulfur carrier subunit
VWKAVSGGLPLPDRILCAVNMDYATLDATVRDGDEVAFFPPVTGG